MMLWAATLTLMLSAQTDPGDVEPVSSSPDTGPAPAAPRAPSPTAPVDAVEAESIAALQRIEGALSVGTELKDADRARLLLLIDSPSPRTRALAAAVLPWLDPTVAIDPLVRACRDPDPLVRATGGQSLVALVRRMSDAHKDAAVAAALGLMDDADDEVACAGAELLGSLHPPGTADAFEARAAAADDVRYGCWVRFGGLPLRPVTLPPLPKQPDDDTPPSALPLSPAPLPEEHQPSWLFIATAASSGLLIGGALPSALIPARDVLVYDDDFTRLSRQDVSFVSQAGIAIAAGAVAGGAAWLLDDQQVLALTPPEQIAVFGGVGSAAVLGAGLGFMLDLKGGGPAWVLAGSTAAGLVGSSALTAVADVSADDNALLMAGAGLGGLAGGLGVFAAVPVALSDVGGVGRTDFGFGTTFGVAGAAGLIALASSPWVEVPAARSAAVVAGGFLGAGLIGGITFAVVPGDLDTGSRIAAGAGLAGQLAGMATGWFIPNAWLGLDDSGHTDAVATPPAGGSP